MPEPPDPSGPLADPVEALLHRPLEQRVREYQYRFAQGAVFGLPVIALQLWGHRLGGSDAARWVPLLQLLLAGWVMYVGVAGMLFEGTIRLVHHGRATADGIAALLSLGLYLASAASVVRITEVEPMFHWSVGVVVVWCGAMWMLGETRRTKPEIRQEARMTKSE